MCPRACPEIQERKVSDGLVSQVINRRAGRVAHPFRYVLFAPVLDVPKPEDFLVLFFQLPENAVDFLNFLLRGSDFAHSLGELDTLREGIVYRPRYQNHNTP